MDLYALGLVLGAVFLLLAGFAWSLLLAHDRGRDGEQRVAAGAALAHAAALREEQLRAGRAEALAIERLRRLEALVAQGRAWAAQPAADTATLAELDAALASAPGAPLDVDAAAERMLCAVGRPPAGAGGPDRGPAAPAAPGPGPAA